jgi:hypothetical protein
MVSVTAFEKMPLDQLLNVGDTHEKKRQIDIQLNLFGD